MKPVSLFIALLVPTLALLGCKRSIDEQDVLEFINHADQAARNRYAPEICELRGEGFNLELNFQSVHEVPSNQVKIDRKLFCRMAGNFSRYRQYRLERRSLEIDIASDAKTARVVAEYVETMPYYEDDVMPATPDDFRHFVVVESHDESVIGIERGDLVFFSAKVDATQTELIPKSRLNLPYD